MWRYLKANLTCEGPRHVFVVDCETSRVADGVHESESLEVLRLGVARYFRREGTARKSRHEYRFQTAAQFWGWLEQRAAARATNWVFAHSAGFDLQALGWGVAVDCGRLRLTRPPRRKPAKPAAKNANDRRTGLLVLDAPPTIIDAWTPSGKHLRFVDTRNWWNRPLADLGQWLGLQKLPMPDPWDSEESWLTYCIRDVEILEQAVARLLDWHREHDLGVFKATAAGQAMQSFRHRFMREKIVLHDEEPVQRLERSAYYAGRLACFYRGPVQPAGSLFADEMPMDWDSAAPRPSGTVYKLDCNSLFPSVMAENLYPRKLVRWNTKPQNLPVNYLTEMDNALASLSLENCSASVPQRVRGKVNFCTGSFTTSLCGRELTLAIRHSAGAVVQTWAEYELADLFSDYVAYFWDLRQSRRKAGDVIEADLCKLLLNALYGKFGQRDYQWVDMPGQVHEPRWDQWVELHAQKKQVQYFRSIGGLVQLKQGQGFHPQSFTAIAAFVTTNARRKMDGYRQTAGWHNVYYQGVDSLFVSRRGLENLDDAGCIDQQALGKLRIEGESDYTEFRGPGYYLFNGRWTQASIRRGARQVAIGQWEQDQFTSLETAATRPQREGVQVKRVRRSIDPDRNAPETTRNGWVYPSKGLPCESSPNATDNAYGSKIDATPSTVG